MVLDLAPICTLKLCTLAIREDITATGAQLAVTLKQLKAQCREWELNDDAQTPHGKVRNDDNDEACIDASVMKATTDSTISLHAATGVSGLKTLRFQAQIKGVPIVVLVDSGSTHNFISEAKAEESKLALEPIEPFVVRIANGERLRCEAKCPNVQIEIQGTTLVVLLFVLPIRGLDMVLGVQWLEESGIVICDCKALTMKFK
ncbi:unnamed protein product [Linum trigynum]|uniref:Uncharacterized protein n=1 Tax=Linum trigynum TaxID=586398 RepID=A0AAV2CXU1_9ROSI